MNNILQYFLFFFLFFFISTNAQKILKIQIDSIKKNESNKEKIHLLTNLLQQQDTLKQAKELGYLYHNLGLVYRQSKKIKKAISLLKKAVFIYNKHNTNTINQSRVLLILCYEEIGNINLENKMLVEIINDNRKDISTSYAYKKLALLKIGKGDYHTAFKYLNILLSNKALTKNITDELTIRFMFIEIYAKMYESISDVNKNNNDLEIVKLHQTIIEKKISISRFNKEYLYPMYNNIGIIYDANKNYNQALKLYNKAYNHYLQKKDTVRFVYGAMNIGILNSKLKKHKIAKKYYQKVINESLDIEQIAAAYNATGYYSDKLSVDKKIFYFQKAINIILSKQFNSETSFILPKIKEIKDTSAPQDILTFLIDLANQYINTFKEKKEKHYLYKAKETLYLIDELVSLIRYESNSELSKLFWIQRGVNTYMLGVEVCYLLNKPDEAFYFMEKNKALLLQENIKNLQAKLALEIPKKIIEREYTLHYQQIELNRKLQRNPNNSKIRELYASENKTYVTFMDSLRQKFPNYVKVKKKIKTITLSKVIEKYTTNTNCFIEYILNEDSGYGLFCSKGEKIVFKIKDVKKLQSDLTLLKKLATKSLLNKDEINSYRNFGNLVFHKLFPFKNALSKITDKKLLIVSDHTLQNLAFEVLQTSLEKPISESYLVNNTEISYLQSFSVFEQIIQKKNTPKYKILGVAPYQFQINDLPELTGSDKSMKVIKQYQSSKILTKDNSTKNIFLKDFNNYEIIHINTHAGLDSLTKEPWIAFRDKKLTLNEMFGIENQANLVILDACKTNDGNLAIGEGIINLSRGFFYNGTQSVLASLWNVNEKSGNTILNSFYKNLQEGKTKSKALQLAKIQYLKTHKNIEILPYYWAAFTLTGNTDNIILNKNNFYTELFIIGIILFVLFYFYRKQTV